MKELADKPIRVTGESAALHWWRMVVWGSQVRLLPPWDEHEANKARRLVRRLVFDTLTRSGKMVALLTVLLFYLSYRHPESFTVLTAALCFSALLASAVVSWFFRPRVYVLRNSPHHGYIGEPFKSVISTTNIGKRPIRDYALREMKGGKAKWDKEWQLRCYERLEPGQSELIDLRFTPNHRCKIQLNGLVIHSYFPGFLVRTSCKRYCPKTVYILPKRYSGVLPSIRLLADQANRFTRGDDYAKGTAPSHHYDQSRLFQLGDSPQRLDHRATARRGEPMTKVYVGEDREESPNIYLFCDICVLDFEPWQPRPDSTLSLNKRLAVAVATVERIYAEQLELKQAAWQSAWLDVESFDQFVEMVATLAPSRQVRVPDQLPDKRGLVVFIVDHWSTLFEDRVLDWRRQGAVVLVFYLAKSQSPRGTLPEIEGVTVIHE